MNVKLIDYTSNAVDKLIYTKSTRLTQGDDTRQKIKAMSTDEKMGELAYMANTIPSSWEFVNYTFEISGVSRAFTHQFVRTRTGCYAQQTMRLLNMEKFEYVTGPTIKHDEDAIAIYDGAMDMIQNTYDKLIEMGVAVEDARGILPTNICTNIIAQFNLRTLAEMGKSRTGKRTQNEYRDVFDGMFNAVLEVHPWAESFLCPKDQDRLKMLEDLIETAEQRSISTDERYAGWKAIDKIRKGEK